MADKHFFDVHVASEIGVPGAIVLEALNYWTKYNAANGAHQRDGKTWVYNTLIAWQRLFPYWSFDQVRRVLEKLKSEGLVLVEKESGSAWNRVNWYAITEKGAALLVGEEWRNGAFGKNHKCIWQKPQMHLAKSPDVEVTTIISSLDTIGEHYIGEHKTLYKSACAGTGASRRACEIPTVEEVRTYCQSRENSIDPAIFVAYYAARNWCLDGTPIYDWKMLVQLWELREEKEQPTGQASPGTKGSFDTQSFFEAAVARSYEGGT